MRFDRAELLDFGKRVKDGVAADDVSGAAAEMAYRFFLALFPFFIFLAALGGYVASLSGVEDPTGEIMDMIGESLPEDSASLLRTQLEGVLQQRSAGLMSIGILGAIWAASSGVGALMKNMNRIHGVKEDRSMPVKSAIAVGLTLFGAGALVLAFVILFVGQLYGQELAAEVGLGGTASTVLGLARWPVVFALILGAVAVLYWLAPNDDLPVKWITPGALFFGVAWIFAGLGFGIYVSNFGSYNETYGALGGVVVLLIWFYLTSFLLLLGAEINSVLLQRKAGPASLEQAPPAGHDGLPQLRPLRRPAAGATMVHAREANVSTPAFQNGAGEPPATIARPASLALAGLISAAVLIRTLRQKGS